MRTHMIALPLLGAPLLAADQIGDRGIGGSICNLAHDSMSRTLLQLKYALGKPAAPEFEACVRLDAVATERLCKFAIYFYGAELRPRYQECMKAYEKRQGSGTEMPGVADPRESRLREFVEAEIVRRSKDATQEKESSKSQRSETVQVSVASVDEAERKCGEIAVGSSTRISSSSMSEIRSSAAASSATASTTIPKNRTSPPILRHPCSAELVMEQILAEYRDPQYANRRRFVTGDGYRRYPETLYEAVRGTVNEETEQNTWRKGVEQLWKYEQMKKQIEERTRELQKKAGKGKPKASGGSESDTSDSSEATSSAPEISLDQLIHQMGVRCMFNRRRISERLGDHFLRWSVDVFWEQRGMGYAALGKHDRESANLFVQNAVALLSGEKLAAGIPIPTDINDAHIGENGHVGDHGSDKRVYRGGKPLLHLLPEHVLTAWSSGFEYLLAYLQNLWQLQLDPNVSYNIKKEHTNSNRLLSDSLLIPQMFLPSPNGWSVGPTVHTNSRKLMLCQLLQRVTGEEKFRKGLRRVMPQLENSDSKISNLKNNQQEGPKLLVSVLEIGVFAGETSLFLLGSCPVPKDVRLQLHLVDPWEDESEGFDRMMTELEIKAARAKQEAEQKAKAKSEDTLSSGSVGKDDSNTDSKPGADVVFKDLVTKVRRIMMAKREAELEGGEVLQEYSATIPQPESQAEETTAVERLVRREERNENNEGGHKNESFGASGVIQVFDNHDREWNADDIPSLATLPGVFFHRGTSMQGFSSSLRAFNHGSESNEITGSGRSGVFFSTNSTNSTATNTNSTIRNYTVPLPSTSFDLTFIDGDHTLKGVSEDISLSAPHTRCILAGHDFTVPGLRGFAGGGFMGIPLALSLFSNNRTKEFEEWGGERWFGGGSSGKSPNFATKSYYPGRPRDITQKYLKGNNIQNRNNIQNGKSGKLQSHGVCTTAPKGVPALQSGQEDPMTGNPKDDPVPGDPGWVSASSVALSDCIHAPPSIHWSPVVEWSGVNIDVDNTWWVEREPE